MTEHNHSFDPKQGQEPLEGSVQPGPGAPPSGALTPEQERWWSLGSHALGFVFAIVAPLIIWLVFRTRSQYVEHHAREALNFQINVFLALLACGVLVVIIVGALMMPVVMMWGMVMFVLAGVKAYQGEWYQYPLTWRIIKD